ncbi:MAG: hypothetical protein GX631_06410 [Dehalococcoidales bacterium]|jgi:hypothetical protein|nr:hypothetical protein [Dehalococcoidales bacterium]
MAEKKYEKHMIRNPFYPAPPEFGGGTMFKHTNDDNMGLIYEHIWVTNASLNLNETRTAETHELYIFVGGDPTNILDFGAEISFKLGEAQEEFIIREPTVMTIPPGMKYGPIKTNKYEKPYVLLRIINTKERQAKLDANLTEEDKFNMKKMLEGGDVAKHGNKLWMNRIRGPIYIDYEPGWTGMSLWAHHDEYKAGISLGYHCVVTPYDVRMSHGHDFHETLAFLSGDPNNPKDLGATGVTHLGDEGEALEFNTPTIISMPPGLKHCPMLVNNIQKPVIFLEVSATGAFKGKPEDR